MKPTVHILARVRKPELLPAALLTFQTLRVGFPTARVQVWGNALGLQEEAVAMRACQAVEADYVNISATSHDAWIESLLLESCSPFWICDTDVAFWKSLEDGAAQQHRPTEFAGRFEPEFLEPWTDTVRVERLHTCLMYIDPAGTRAAIRKFMSRIPEDLRQSAQFPMVREYFIPVRNGKTLFYDTMAGLYQAGAGTPFTEGQNDCFDHLNCATYADLIAPHLDVPDLQEQHKLVYANPALLRGARHAQAKFYERHKWPWDTQKRKKGAKCHTHPE